MSSFVIGLLSATAAFKITKHPQPALVYIVPLGLISVFWWERKTGVWDLTEERELKKF